MSWTTFSPDLLADARLGRARWLRAELDAAPGIEVDDYFASRARRDRALADLADHLRTVPNPARITTGTDKASVAMLGIRATSTSGLDGALRNWIARVMKEHGA